MATASDIAEVRANTNEPDNTLPYTDAVVGAYIDSLGVAGASAKIWQQKAATLVETSVDVTEAGASHKFSDLHKNALAMSKYWDAIAAAEFAPATGPVVNSIVRES